MRDSEVLKNYRVAVLEIGLLERQIERLGGVGGPDGYGQYSLDRVAKGTNHREAAAMQRYDGLTGILERKRDALRQMTQRCEDRFQFLDGFWAPTGNDVSRRKSFLLQKTALERFH